MINKKGIIACLILTYGQLALGAQYSDYTGGAIANEAWSTPFNKIAQVACHNCYEPHTFTGRFNEALPFKAVLDYVAAIEIDIWDTYHPISFISSGEKRNWYVRHGNPEGYDMTGFAGNHSNCTPPGSLAECLSDISEWSDDHPNHFPITLFLDKKQSWSAAEAGRGVKDLFWLLKKKLGIKLYMPRDHIRMNQATNNSPKQWKWPIAKDLAGRIVVVINGGNFFLDTASRYLSPGNSTYNIQLNEFSMYTRGAAAFAGPYAFTSMDFRARPKNISSMAIFLNSSYSSAKKSLTGSVFPKENRMIRLWNVDDQDFCSLVQLRVSYAAYFQFRKQQCKGVRILPMYEQ